MLKYQLNEIEEAELKPGEDEELEQIRSKILNSEKISENLNEIDTQIGENAIDSISAAVKALERIENIDEKYQDKLNNLKSIYYDLQELSRDINTFKEDVEFNEEERQNVEERLDLIFSLKRKYGNDIKEILLYKDEIEEEVSKIENLDEYINKLKEEKNTIEEVMRNTCKKMHEIREENAVELSKQINKQLQDLEMKNAKFEINIKYDQIDFNENGLDKIEFFIKTNIGEEAKSLIKIASGGEMSRIMLAIKNVLADVDKVPVLVFDEIDTGISGVAANSVAQKMKEIGRTHQVLCVTHLASIAAKGDYNYYIHKEIANNQTSTKVKILNEEETIKEIARIASGEVTDIALQHAQELRKK